MASPYRIPSTLPRIHTEHKPVQYCIGVRVVPHIPKSEPKQSVPQPTTKPVLSKPSWCPGCGWMMVWYLLVQTSFFLLHR
jgi:hypothetical protein